MISMCLLTTDYYYYFSPWMQFWTESFVQWSPLGTYLATVHRQGAAIWGGANSFERLMRYPHPQVKNEVISIIV